jgi:hypothetical protein
MQHLLRVHSALLHQWLHLLLGRCLLRLAGSDNQLLLQHQLLEHHLHLLRAHLERRRRLQLMVVALVAHQLLRSVEELGVAVGGRRLLLHQLLRSVEPAVALVGGVGGSEAVLLPLAAVRRLLLSGQMLAAPLVRPVMHQLNRNLEDVLLARRKSRACFSYFNHIL